MTDKRTDWRLTGQQSYLQGRSWALRKYPRPRPDWDHDHCSFCHVKFMEKLAPGVLDEGYTTDDDYWVCPSCFEDFRGQFAWTVASEQR